MMTTNTNSKIYGKVGYDEDLLKEKEDEILKLRKGLEIVMEGAAEMERMIEIDGKMIKDLSTKLETALMDNADANANADSDSEADPNSLPKEFDQVCLQEHDYNQDHSLNIEIATLNAKMAAESIGDAICLLQEQNKYDDRVSTAIEIQRELKELGSRIGDLFGVDDDEDDGRWTMDDGL